MQFIRSDENDSGESELHLDLEPGTSDLLIFVHAEEHVQVAIKGHQIKRRLSRDELMQQTAAMSEARPIPGSDCQIKMLRTPYDGGFLIINPEGPPEKTMDITFTFELKNFKIEGKEEGETEIRKVVRPGTQEFFML